MSGPLVELERAGRGPIADLSFAAAAGETVKLVASSRDSLGALLKILAGLAHPSAGRVRVLGVELYEVAEAGRLAVLERVGFVPENGGLISNLKVWENIVLPSWYHRDRSAAVLEAEVVRLLAGLGVASAAAASLMGQLPDQLSDAERRLVAMVRAWLMDPELLVYDGLLSGLDRETSARFIAATADFHARRKDRASLYLCQDDAISARIRADRVVRLD